MLKAISHFFLSKEVEYKVLKTFHDVTKDIFAWFGLILFNIAILSPELLIKILQWINKH